MTAPKKKTGGPGFDYNEVADRVRGFNEEYPAGRINTFAQIMIANGKEHVSVRAEVWKTRDADAPDATGYSWLEVPGKTNFTRGSELENAETSAVGRALAFIGFYAKGESLASKQEIAAKSGESKAEPKPKKRNSEPTAKDEAKAAVVGSTDITDAQRKMIFALIHDLGWDEKRKSVATLVTTKDSFKLMTREDAVRFIDLLVYAKDGETGNQDFDAVIENIGMVEEDA